MEQNGFEKIFKTARIAAEKNKEVYAERLELDIIENDLPTEEKIKKEVKKAVWEVVSLVNKSNVYSEELFNIIHDLRFNILEYGKRMDDIDFYEEYDPIVEYYTVQFNDYKFVVKNMYDVDITDGIFGVHEIENLKTNEKIHYYLDLGCRNTGKERLNDFILLLSCNSKDEFLDKKYGLYKNLPTVLKSNGINIVENTLKFDLQRINGYIKIEDKIYVIPYLAWHDEVRLVITNTHHWDVNSSNDMHSIGYYIDDYKSEKDINIIIDNIKAFEKHMKGQYGFYENDRYYNNRDILNFLNVERTSNGDYLECFNHRLIEIDLVREWDGRGYGNPYINLYKGLEIAVHFKVTFNDACQWSIGDIINHSDIIIKYDKNIDKDNCILMIKNYQYKNDDDIFADDYDYDESNKIDSFSNEYSDDYLVDNIEINGSFVSIMKTLTEYLNKMCSIFNIEEVFKFN